MAGRVVVNKVQEFIKHPFVSSGVSVNGIQFDAQVNVVNVEEAEWKVINTFTYNVFPETYGAGGIGVGKPGWSGLDEVLVGYTFAVKCDNSDAILKYQLQGRNKHPEHADSWVALSDVEEQTRPFNTAFFENTVSGYVLTQNNFNAVPFELRVVVNTNCLSNVSLTETKMKSSSYVKYRYGIS